MAIKTMSKITDPITGTKKVKTTRLYDTKKVVHTKDDAKEINEALSEHNKDWGINRVTGKPRTSSAGGYKVSGNCEACKPRGHNIRDPKFVEDKEHIDPKGLFKIYTDMGPIEKCYKEIFADALKEYNNKQTRKSRRIENYLTHILQDQRRGTMKKNSKVDNSRKPCYEIIFEIGNRDHQIDRNLSIEILEKFCNEWMPEHYPNLKAIGVYLHADEFTIDPITKKRIDSAPHIHFDFIPIAHRLTSEEKEDFENWKKELKEKEKTECKAQGKKFSSEEFESRDWAFERAKKYGKSELNSLSLQSSLSGACAEMGFRTQGMNTAQIQLERSIREDLYDLVESYGIPVDRTVNKNAEAKVRIEVYKAREDNKKILAEMKELDKEIKSGLKELNKKDAEISRREEAVEGLEEKKKDVEKREKEVAKREERVAPYVERIDTLIEDEKRVQEDKTKNEEVSKIQEQKELELQDRETKIESKEAALEDKEAEINSSIENLNAREEKNESKEKALDSREEALNQREKSLDDKEVEIEEMKEQNEADKKTNEKNAKEIYDKFESFGPLEEKYKKYLFGVNLNEKVVVNFSGVGSQLKTELMEPGSSWRDKIDYAVANFTERCQKIVTKFQDAIRGFTNFLQGKTSNDLRKLADDMDRNGTRTFEEYESRWSSETLDWQVEQRKQKLQLKPHHREIDIER